MGDLNRQQLMDAIGKQPKKQRTELYRHFDASGRLLYVGISLSTAHRMGQHRNTSEWSHRVRTITIEHFPTREAALDAETEAIRTERPAFNKMGRVYGPGTCRVKPTLRLVASDPEPPTETPLQKYFREAKERRRKA